MSAVPQAELLLVGWDFRTAPLDLRERLAFTPDAIRAALANLREEGLLAEGVIVSTCNRSEIYGVSSSEDGDGSRLSEFVARFHGLPEPELRRTSFRHSGAAATRHLFRVAAGLESLALGEDQVLHQVREAFQVAAGAGAARSVLHRMFQKAFAVGKRVRTETALSSRPTSIPGVALELAQKVYEDLASRRFLILGAGETASIFYDLILSRGARRIEVANRTLERAQALAARGGTARRLDEVPGLLAQSDIVVCATGSPQPILKAENVARALDARRGEPMLILDLGVPRNAEAGIAKLENAFLSAVDDLEQIAARNRNEREADIPRAEAIIEEELTEFAAWFGALAVVPTLTELRRRFDAVREEAFDRAIAEMKDITPAQRERLQRVARSLVNSLLHDPTEALKSEPDPLLRVLRAEAVRQIFRLDDERGG